MSEISVSQLGLFDTITIPLTQGYVTVIDAVDADLAELKWTAAVNDITGKIYAYRHKRSNGDQIFINLHRVLLERIIGRVLLPGEMPDHKDDNSLNNRRENLRIASSSQNNANRKLSSRNTSGFKGASFKKSHRKWVAVIGVNRRSIHLGYFDTPEEAHAAYCEAALKHFGEFARLS